MIDLSSQYLGLKIKNPIVIGSSGLSSTLEDIKELASAGAGAIVLKSVFEEEIQNEYSDLLNNQLGFQENNLEFLDYYDYEIKKEVLGKTASLIRAAKKCVQIPIIGSINCLSSAEWVNYSRVLQDAGADALEFNIFKLPFKTEASSEEIEKVYFDVVEKVNNTISIPFGLKIAPYFTNLGNVIHRLSKTEVAGLVLFNRFYNIDFDIENDKIVSGYPFSSQSDYHNALRWISVMADRVECDLVASTGVHDSSTLIKMIMAGAASVEVVSAIYKNGVGIISTVLKELERWMNKRDFDSLADFRGKLSQKKGLDSDRFERLQFMKYYSDRKK